MRINPNDIIGKKFGKLTVIELHHTKQHYQNNKKDGIEYFYLCKCECGNYKIIRRTGLFYSPTISCGCYSITKLVERTKTHGLTNTKIYVVWRGIKTRCTLPTDSNFKNYGGRGIKMCDEWLHDFKAFYDWSIANGYKEGLTIDRIDVNGNYEPLNCRWVDRKVQNNNKRNNHFITFNNQTHTLSEWAKITGIYRKTIDYRLLHGWSIEKALTTPVHHSSS